MLTDRLYVALTIRAEAEGEPVEGRIAVGCVIRNRVKDPGWWGDSYTTVCLKPKQFSCWNESTVDRNHLRLMALKGRVERGDVILDPLWDECLWIADGVIGNRVGDNTHGATHYHTTAVSPIWAQQARKTATIGAHNFFTDVA
jgi:N-acetylmuramoyl-L-alanine amidase